MALPVQKDHVTTGLNRMPSMWQDKPYVQGLLKSYLEQFNEIESVFFEILTERGIYEAVGEQLDVIGALFGEFRNNRLDEPYRQAILSKTISSLSDGTTEVVLTALRSIAAQDTHVQLFEHSRACAHSWIGEADWSALYESTKSTFAAGVAHRIIADDHFDSIRGSEIFEEVSDLQVNLNISGGAMTDLQVATGSILEYDPAEITVIQAMYIGNSGSKMYLAGGSNIYQYTLSTPYDITTASYDSKTYSVAAQTSTIFGLTFKADGTQFFVNGASSKYYAYNITAWDVSTAAYAADTLTSAAAGRDGGIWMKADGTEIYVAGGSAAETVAKYTLSTPWQLSSGTLTQESSDLSLLAGDVIGAITDIGFTSDGLTLFLTDYTPSTRYRIQKFSLTSAFDLSTITHDKEIPSHNGDILQAFYNKDAGDVFYTGDVESGMVYQFSGGDQSYSDIQITTFSSEEDTTYAIPAEILDSVLGEPYNPFAELLYTRVNMDGGLVVDDGGDFIVDEDGNFISWVEFSY